MFNIAIDESASTCNSHELVKADVENAKKHRAFLNIRHKTQNMNKKAFFQMFLWQVGA